MGTIIGRTRKDGSKAFTAQIVIKTGGVVVHREAQTFDRKQAANAWIVNREAELKRPGGLERKEDPTLSAVIDRYIAESKNVVLGTKAQVLKAIKNSNLGETKCGAHHQQHAGVVRAGPDQVRRTANVRQLLLSSVQHFHCCQTGLGLPAVAAGIRRRCNSYKKARFDPKG